VLQLPSLKDKNERASVCCIDNHVLCLHENHVHTTKTLAPCMWSLHEKINDIWKFTDKKTAHLQSNFVNIKGRLPALIWLSNFKMLNFTHKVFNKFLLWSLWPAFKIFVNMRQGCTSQNIGWRCVTGSEKPLPWTRARNSNILRCCYRYPIPSY